MKKHINKVKSYFVAHKVVSVVVLIVILLISYWGYKKITSTAGENRYVVAKVEKGTIVASVSGTGQVSALNQIDIKSKVSGNVLYISSQNGEKVSTGALIAQLDTKDAQKSVRDAEINLESAKISLDKLKIQKSNENLNSDLKKAYGDSFNTISSVFLDLPGIMTGLNDMFFKSNSGTRQQNNVDWYEEQVGSENRDQAAILKQNFLDSYNKAKKYYDQNSESYKTISRTSENAVIENFILQTYDTVKLISDAIKNANNYIDFVNDSLQKRNVDIPAIINIHRTSLNTYTSKTNTHLVNLLEDTSNIKNYKDAFPNADLDMQSAELSVKQKENMLADTKDKLADYFIRAPFEGTVAKINVKKSDEIGIGTAIATLITKRQLAEISLNEIDVAKIKVGQMANLTFDAIPDLIIRGFVEEIDSVGTVAQGVVTYNVKISFDNQDERIKPSMSVSAEIITDTKENVLIAPNSAIKTQGGKKSMNYVEMFKTSPPPPAKGSIGSISKIAPIKIPVEVGLVGSSRSEVVSGVKEGDEVVIRTILPTANTTTAPSIFGSNTGNRGNSARIPAR